MNKNDEVTVTIEDMGEGGEGIGHADGLTLFVKDAVIGDTVLAGITKVKKTCCYARTIKVITPSEYRIQPVCKSSRACGGCQLQALSYEAQLEFKRKKVEACFERIGGFKCVRKNEALSEGEIFVKETLGMKDPWHYRNKAQFPVGKDKDGNPVAGFYAGRTHSIIPTEDCAIEFGGHEKILAAVLEYMKEAGVSVYDETSGSGVVRHILMRKGFATGQIMVVLVVNASKIKREELLVKKLLEIETDSEIVSIQLNINTEKTNVILGKKCVVLYGKSYIVDKIGEISFRISALSFYQVNPAQTVVLYEEALKAGFGEDNDSKDRTVWDMYCGTGTISLFLAQRAKQVYGVEIIPQAVENAKENAEINGVKNAEFFCGAAEEVVPALYKKDEEKYRADIVVVDPPRKGCDAVLLNTIAEMAPEKIVYVSCDPATLARDCRILSDSGYEVKSVRPVDMFAHGVGVETVVMLKYGGRRK